MDAAETSLVFPLRSNGQSLVTGSSVESVRKRMKRASLLFDHLLLEAGVVTITAGPNGSSTFQHRNHVSGASRQVEPWQTPGQRGREIRAGFTISMGREDIPGIPAQQLQPVLASAATISWRATFEPFDLELPSSCDWVSFVVAAPASPRASGLQRDWNWEDKRNRALDRLIPERFVRDAVIEHANYDLSLISTAGMAGSMDSLHSRVAAGRLATDANWKMTGFGLTIVLPSAGDLGWDVIEAFRGDKQLSRFRAVLRQVENEALEEASGGDVEAAVHHAFERHLADAGERLQGLGSVASWNMANFVVGAGAGLATVGIVGPWGLLAGSALAVVPGTAIGAVQSVRARRKRGWKGLYQRIRASA